MLVEAVHAFFSHFLAVNTFVVGLTLNVAVLGLTSILSIAIVLSSVQISQWSIPGLSSIPILGDAVFTQRWAAFLVGEVGSFNDSMTARTQALELLWRYVRCCRSGRRTPSEPGLSLFRPGKCARVCLE